MEWSFYLQSRYAEVCMLNKKEICTPTMALQITVWYYPALGAAAGCLSAPGIMFYVSFILKQYLSNEDVFMYI